MMLDTEQTALGLYLPDATDPDTCQPLATALWEVSLLQRHYHPTVAKLARRVASGDAGVADRPQAIYRQFDVSRGIFNPAVKLPPPQPLAKRPAGTAVGLCGTTEPSGAPLTREWVLGCGVGTGRRWCTRHGRSTARRASCRPSKASLPWPPTSCKYPVHRWGQTKPRELVQPPRGARHWQKQRTDR